MVKTQQAILRKRSSAVGWFGLHLPYYLVVQAIENEGKYRTVQRKIQV